MLTSSSRHDVDVGVATFLRGFVYVAQQQASHLGLNGGLPLLLIEEMDGDGILTLGISLDRVLRLDRMLFRHNLLPPTLRTLLNLTMVMKGINFRRSWRGLTRV